uniref:Uncharacterized protein n=1 Tax=Panagrolaimus davidi TaxID=227884 RepID=A0A914QAH2_9BILA
MEEHHREYMNNRHESVVFKEFLNYSSAILWATEWQRMLENGEYDKVYEELNKHFNQELSFAKMPKHCLYLYDQYFIPGEILSVGSREGVYIGDGYVIYVSNGEDIHQRKVKERKLEDFVGNEADAIYVKVFRIQKCSQYEIILAAKHYAEYNMCGALESLCALGYENLDNSVIPRNKLNKSTLTQLYRACHAQTMTLLGYKSHKHHLNYLMQTMKEKLCFAAAFMGFFAGIMCKISAVNIEDQKYIEFPMFCNISEIPPSFKEKIKAIVYIFDDFKYLSLLETEKKMLEKNFMNNGIFCSMISTDFIIINELSSKLKLLQNEIAIVVFVDKIKLKIIEVFRDGNNMLRESNVREENVTELDYNSMDSIILGYIANPKYIIAIKPEYYDGSRALWKIVKRKMKDIRGFEVYKRDWSTNISTVSTLQEISGQFENISEEYLAKKEIATFLV